MIAEGVRLSVSFTAANGQKVYTGVKSETRRVLRPQPESEVAVVCAGGEKTYLTDWDGRSGVPITCPYGKIGDLLYVKEPFAWSGDQSVPEEERVERGEVWYQGNQGRRRPDGIRWRSPRFMWRWASRTVVRITNIRLERVQDIGVEDCMAEGIRHLEAIGFEDQEEPDYRKAFRFHWDLINGFPKPSRANQTREFISFPWESNVRFATHKGAPHAIYGNPWVWVVTFCKERSV